MSNLASILQGATAGGLAGGAVWLMSRWPHAGIRRRQLPAARRRQLYPHAHAAEDVALSRRVDRA